MSSVVSRGTDERMAARTFFNVLRAGSGTAARYCATVLGAAPDFIPNSKARVHSCRFPGFTRSVMRGSVAARALICIGHAQDGRFVEMFSEDLQADRQVLSGFAARDRNSRNTRQVRGHGVNVREIHCQRIVYLLAQFESSSRAGGRDDGIDLLESFVEITG